MKTAKEWEKCFLGDKQTNIEAIKAIQLDAIKEGMTRAANLISEPTGETWQKQNILTARDNLKEI